MSNDVSMTSREAAVSKWTKAYDWYCKNPDVVEAFHDWVKEKTAKNKPVRPKTFFENLRDEYHLRGMDIVPTEGVDDDGEVTAYTVPDYVPTWFNRLVKANYPGARLVIKKAEFDLVALVSDYAEPIPSDKPALLYARAQEMDKGGYPLECL